MNLKGVAAASHTRNLRSDHEKTFKKAINFRERLKLKTKTITRPFEKWVTNSKSSFQLNLANGLKNIWISKQLDFTQHSHVSIKRACLIKSKLFRGNFPCRALYYLQGFLLFLLHFHIILHYYSNPHIVSRQNLFCVLL